MLNAFWGRALPSPTVVGPEFDYLATTIPSLEPAFRNRDSIKQSAVVACMRNEGIVILEWVAHYRALGFDSIFIYANDNDDGSDELLLALHKAGIITLIWNHCRPDVSPQFKAYRHALWHSPEVWEHDWIAFLDADEFLIPQIDGRLISLPEYLDHLERNFGCSAVSLNWRWFAGDQKYERSQGLLFERYRDASWSDHVKTLFRLRDACDVNVHCPKMLPGCAVIGGSGKVRALPSHAEEPDGTLGQVNHYWQRSFQEFYFKRERGRSGAERDLRAWSTFFDWADPSTPDPYPDRQHVDRVLAELKSLRQIRAVRRARREIERIFSERAQSSAIKGVYAATLDEVASRKASNAATAAISGSLDSTTSSITASNFG